MICAPSPEENGLGLALRLLVLEDRPDDLDLMLHALRQEGFAPTWRRVETETDYLAHLHEPIDIILADYVLPQFDALRALQLLQERDLDIPFIVVTGNVGEEKAVECMKLGAADYLLKERLTRLGPAVKQALHGKRLRDEKRQAETALNASEMRYRSVVEGASQGIIIWQNATILYANNTAVQMFGYDHADEMIGRDIWETLVLPAAWPELQARATDISQGKRVSVHPGWQGHRRNGTRIWVESAGSMISWQGQPAIVAFLTDITERRRLERELLAVSEREQRRLGQDLHDGLGQHLTGLAFLSKGLEQTLRARAIPEATELAQIGTLIDQAIEQTRTLARGLYPVALETNGLPTALQLLGHPIETVLGITFQVVMSDALSLPEPPIAIHLYRIVQEAVNNAVRHGKAQHIAIHLDTYQQGFRLTIDDDGIGLPGDIQSGPGMGLRIMHYRARMIGASLKVQRRLTGGTQVTCKLPLYAAITEPTDF